MIVVEKGPKPLSFSISPSDLRPVTIAAIPLALCHCVLASIETAILLGSVRWTKRMRLLRLHTRHNKLQFFLSS